MIYVIISYYSFEDDDYDGSDDRAYWGPLLNIFCLWSCLVPLTALWDVGTITKDHFTDKESEVKDVKTF